MEQILATIKSSGLPSPHYRRGWQYVGQAFLEWSGSSGIQLQVELLVTKDDRLTAKLFVCDPFGTEPDAGYRLIMINDVLNHLPEFLEAIELFFPTTKNGLKLCLELSKVVFELCRTAALRGESKLVLPRGRSAYQEQLKFFEEALKGSGLSQVESTESSWTISWACPATPFEKELRALIPK